MSCNSQSAGLRTLVKNNYASITVSVALLSASVSWQFAGSSAFAKAPLAKGKGAAAAAVKKVVPPDYYPLADTYWWKYKGSSGGNNIEFTLKVVGIEKQPDGRLVYQLDTCGQQVIHDWYVKEKGSVLRLKEHYGDNAKLRINYEPPYCNLHNPLLVGDKWSWQGKGLMDVSINDQSQVEAEEDVEVPAGKFRAMKVVSNVQQGPARVVKTYWYAPGLGLIKTKTENNGIVIGTELVDYSFKQNP